MKTSLHLDVDPHTHSDDVERILTCQDGRTFCTVGADRRVQVWRDDDEPCRSLLTSSPNRSGRATGDGAIRAAALHPDGTWLVMAVTNQDTTDLWTLDIDDDVVDVHEWPTAVTALAFEPTGGKLFIATAQQFTAHHVSHQVPSSFSAFETVALDRPARAVACGVLSSGATRVAVLLHSDTAELGAEASGPSPALELFEVQGERMERLAAPPSLPADTIDLVTNGVMLLVVAVDSVELRDFDGARSAHLDVPGPVSGGALGLHDWLAVATASAVTVYSTSTEFEVLSTRQFDDRVHAIGAVDAEHVVSAGGSRQTIRAWTHWDDSTPGSHDDDRTL